MFHRLGNMVARHWLLVILAWVVLVVGLRLAQRAGIAPQWNDITYDGDLAYLPEDMTSIHGEKLLEQAFPDDRAKSRFVVVVARPDDESTPDKEELTAEDRAFVGLVARSFREESFADRLAEKLSAGGAHIERPILDVLSPFTDVIGRMLASRDKQAQLVVLTLSNEFMATGNILILDFIKSEMEELSAQAPDGLQWGLTGSAAIGGDMLTSAGESIKNTELTTLVLVVATLLIIYRAPLLVLIPLLSIAFSIFVATSLVAMLTQLHLVPGFAWWDLKVFTTTRIFVVVILFGAGTDYCLFLIARYEEELSRGLTRSEALAEALGKVGDALAASALTTIVGLATMFFAAFGKFSSSGPVIAICLAVALLACMTLAPALIRAFGRVIFWPFGAAKVPQERWRGVAPASTGRGIFRGTWQSISGMILARPGLILTLSLLVLLPLAYSGSQVDVTYDLLGELKNDRSSVIGTRLLWQHFPPGETGPVTVLAHKEDGAFDTKQGEIEIARLTKFLYDLDGVVSVRSIAEPLGDKPGYTQLFGGRGLAKMAARRHPLTMAKFVAQQDELKGRVARFDVILEHDPFSLEAVELLDSINLKLVAMQDDSASAWFRTEFNYIGTTAGIRDLKYVTESDRQLIQRLVVIAVLAVLLVILRRPLICFYLILSVLLSFFVTIGITELFFQWLYGATFHGLDWKVPLFLFVILIAVGEDYNIYLTTRVFEEQERLGPREGLRTALVQTGGIITSCGIIMAGTFVSMTTGTLRGMTELGFALSLGVLLDTFVVRTVLVPAFFSLIIPRSSQSLVQAADAGATVVHQERTTHV